MKNPIISTKNHLNYLTDGCWSPTRPGLLFVTRKDGWLNIWDLFYKHNDIALSHKVSDKTLTCIKINNVTSTSQSAGPIADIGKFCAIGDANETITLLKLCKSLYKPQNDEKGTINEILERERFREDSLKKLRIMNEKKMTAEKDKKKNDIQQREKLQKQ